MSKDYINDHTFSRASCVVLTVLTVSGSVMRIFALVLMWLSSLFSSMVSFHDFRCERQPSKSGRMLPQQAIHVYHKGHFIERSGRSMMLFMLRNSYQK